MTPTTKTLIAASLLLAVAAAVPAAEADPVGACVQDTCVDSDSSVPTVIVCEPLLGCYRIHPEVEADPTCTVSGDGSGVRAECHGG